MSQFLKCDATDCEHFEYVDEITVDMVDKACPICGANLLTKQDWDFYSTVMLPGMKLMNALGLSTPADIDTPEHLRMRVHGHNGELRIQLPSAITTKSTN